MLIPVRCFSCGKVLANKWRMYCSLAHKHGRHHALQTLKLRRYCCRTVFLCHFELHQAMTLTATRASIPAHENTTAVLEGCSPSTTDAVAASRADGSVCSR